ncbi:hypothetical protein ACFO5Q_07115 [Kordiimonas lipolytica]|uniref:DUF1211 domain-containing protein n=1 Tax=Kordiimonas lipolytica TaxID=1662421 RepID=A0ABV8U9Y5_9PROT|nr:hypothetical protein [Kordiimonas lipolytica]
MFGTIHDSRALMGGLAMMIIGAILSIMMAFYLLPDIFGEGALVSRWWWEIVLNLQILCLAFMWFSHHNRILYAQGWWRLRAITHFVTGVISVSYPVGIMLIAAYNDWFREGPTPSQVYLLVLGGIALWAVGNFIVPILVWLMVRSNQKQGNAPAMKFRPVVWVQAFWPTLAALMVAALVWWRQESSLSTLVPVLLYLQGALPYFRKARHASPRDSDI